jgi:hypothetical protein
VGDTYKGTIKEVIRFLSILKKGKKVDVKFTLEQAMKAQSGS